MIGSLFKSRKKKPASVTTVSLEELATLWRDPVEPKGEPKTVPPKKEIPETEANEPQAPKPQSVDLAVLINEDETSPVNNSVSNNDSWFDQKTLLKTLQSRIPAGRTSAFVYKGTAYYTLETVTKALNQQREHHHLKPLTPNEVIVFFKSEIEGGINSGKYLLRFDKKLPLKVYLYTHPIADGELPESPLPMDETGRRLKSLKRIEGYTA